MKIKTSGFTFSVYSKPFSVFLHIQTPKQIKTHQRLVWLYFKSENECGGKYHFALDIPKVISMGTVYKGKKILGSRINLLSLFNKDYKSYSSGDDVMGSC